jgi:glycerate 2-kinase
VRVVIAPDTVGSLDAATVAEAVARGWRRGAPEDEPVVVADLAGLDAALDDARLVVTGEATFDWRSLRGSHIAAVAGAAVARGVPCLVLAEQVSVGRREAAAVGVDAAYAISDGAGGPPDAAFAGLAEEVARRWSR